MAKIKFFIIIPIFLILNKTNSQILPERELIFVYEHARHGARGPSASYNSIFENGIDEYNVTWDFDGELTQIGKRQHYYLGVRNRIKYGHFINFSEYNPMEIVIHATDYNRTHQSINSELIGMYGYGKERELTDKEMNYTIINDKYINLTNISLAKEILSEMSSIGKQVNHISFPVFNIRKFPDNRIFIVDNCEKIDQYRDEKVGYKVEILYKEFKDKYADILAKMPLIDNSYFRIYNKMKSIADHFICDYDNQKNLSSVENLGLNLSEFYNFSRRFYGSFIFDWFVDNYTSGLEETHLMQDVLAYMERRIEHYKEGITYSAPKMVMDCGHDTTVGPIARFMSSAFGVKYHDFCDFACNVYFELYREVKNGEEKFTVDYYLDDERLLYREDFYKSFKPKMEAKFWNDTFAKEFCEGKGTTYIEKKGIDKYSTILLGATFISTTLFLIFITSTFIFYNRFKKLQKRLKENPLLDQEIEGSELPELT